MDFLANISWLDLLWTITLLGTSLLLLSVYAASDWLAKWNSNPWAFELKKNVDLDFQSVLYASYHVTWPGMISHMTLPIDAMMWLVVMYMWEPALLMVGLLLLAYQSTRFSDKVMVGVSLAGWAVLTVGALVFINMAGGAFAFDFARWFLMFGGMLRFVGHFTEPVPPLIASDDDKFHDISEAGFNLKLIPVSVLGYFSEFASGLPYRLVYVHFGYFAYKIGGLRNTLSSWPKAVEMAKAIHANGWRAYKPMSDLVKPFVKDDAPVARQE